MDQATENANETIKQLGKERIALKRSINNRKQLEIFAGYNLWAQASKLGEEEETEEEARLKKNG